MEEETYGYARARGKAGFKAAKKVYLLTRHTAVCATVYTSTRLAELCGL